MKVVKTFIKYCYRLISNSFLELKDLYVYQRHKKKRIRYESTATKAKKALVFGNGPSLKDFLNKNECSFPNADIFVCNGFSLTDKYEFLKPVGYVLLDPLYFEPGHPKVKDKIVNVAEIWDSFISKTSWDITLYTSTSDKHALNFIERTISRNPHIKWQNIYPIKFNSKNQYQYYSKGLGLIGGVTVTHFSVQVAILSFYKEVYMCGIDLDWIENINYDNENQKLYLLNKHFYDEFRIYYGEGIFEGTDIADELAAQYELFKLFKELLQVAVRFNVELFRATRSFAHFIPFKEYNGLPDCAS